MSLVSWRIVLSRLNFFSQHQQGKMKDASVISVTRECGMMETQRISLECCRATLGMLWFDWNDCFGFFLMYISRMPPHLRNPAWWRKRVVECFTDLTLAFEEFFVSKWPCREASWRSFRSMTTFVSAEKFYAKWENFQETRASWLWSYIQEVNSCEYSFNSEISAAWSYSNYSFHPSLLLLIKSISLTCFHQWSS